MSELCCNGTVIPRLYNMSREEYEEGCDDLDTINRIHKSLVDNGMCYVKVLSGDYEGSVAMFTPERLDQWKHHRCYNGRYNISAAWYGRLSWVGKRNNPQFTLTASSATVLEGYEGNTELKRFDLKKAAKALLDDHKTSDINGNLLYVGDSVVYLNLRYGEGGRLCEGAVKEFKAHARQGYVSTIIQKDGCDELSECRHPSDQIFKKEVE